MSDDAKGVAVPRSDGPVTVVVADDHPLWRDAVARDLADAGMTVLATADDGPSAVNRTKATRPDVLVLDLNLPGMARARGLRAPSGRLATRVLILSASGEHQDVLEAVKAGATGYLVKSASSAEIIEAVRRDRAGEAVFTPGLAGPGARRVPTAVDRARRPTPGAPSPS